ncbi:PoNe immunity protein domain-containing protein [Labilibacter marinus]|uniref:PoNe immunity protein domain-containing protein n=1 Tax=Labilibacter marinus TaxID=1477105 RepID=UPI0009501ACF|nr:PoNe immunity protein domain-containing protein [Labilibacter marinus]
MARDKNRDDEHFLTFISTKAKSHEARIKKLEQGQIKPDRIKAVKENMVTNLVQKLVATYSAGMPICTLTEDFDTILELMEDSWADGSQKLVGAKALIIDQYSIDSHSQLLRVLSIGILIGIPDNLFERLGKIIKSDNVIDLVYEFLLSSKLDLWVQRQEKDDYAFKLYLSLKKAIKYSNKKESEKLVKLFLEKDWLKEQKKAQMLTEPGKAWYYGRWSFESAAVSCILDLDDSSYRDNEYYPKDLVDYYREKKLRKA